MDNWEFPEFPFPVATTLSQAQTPNHVFQTSTSHEEAEETGYSADSDDPRNAAAIHRSPQRQVKSAKVNLLHQLARDFLRENGFIPPKKSPVVIPEVPSGPSTAIAEAYINRVHSGPTLDNIQIDWRLTMDHEWNARALQLLHNKFILHLKEERLIDLVRLVGSRENISDSAVIAHSLSEISDVKQLLSSKLKSRRSKLKTGLKKVNMMPNASRNEVEERIKRDYAEEILRSRRYERKKNLYIRRGETIIQKLQSVQGSDREMWNSIQVIFAHLKQEDISSDETEVEDMFGSPKIVRRVRKAWLSPVISKVMNFVDTQYRPRNPNGTLKRGAPPLRREWTSKSINTRSLPKPFLPRNFYSTEVIADVLTTLLPKPEVGVPAVPEPRSLLAQYPLQAPAGDLNSQPNDTNAMDTH